MEYVKLGNTGMDVSRICLGCMGFGNADVLRTVYTAWANPLRTNSIRNLSWICLIVIAHTGAMATEGFANPRAVASQL
jgi:hypothetical protein